MNDSNDNAKKDTLKVANPGRLQLTKTVESGKVKQNFTHGRSKSVTVEVRKTRTFAQGGTGGMVEVKQNAGGVASSSQNIFAGADDDSMRHLTHEERQSRLKALKLAEEQMKLEAELAAKRQEEEKRQRALKGDAPTVEPKKEAKVEKIIPSSSGIVTPIKQEPVINEAKVQAGQSSSPKAGKISHHVAPVEEVEQKEKGGKLKLRGGEDRRSSGKITINQALSSIEDQRMRSMASIRRAREKAIKKAMGGSTESEKVIRDVIIPEAISVGELANRMAERTVDVIKTLMKLGIMATATQSVDADTAELVVGEFGHKFKRVTEGDVENILKDDEQEEQGNLLPRPPNRHYYGAC